MLSGPHFTARAAYRLLQDQEDSKDLLLLQASSPAEDQDVRLAPSTTVPDDEVPAAAHGPRLPRGVSAVRKGSGGLLALILCVPPGPGGMAGGERQLPRGNFGGILVISR